MKIVWDEAKNAKNRRKHKVGFETAQRVFDDPLHVSKQDRIEGGEQRWQTIGLVHDMALLLVVHTYIDTDGDEVIRIVSARKADRSERGIYEENQ